MWIKGLCLSKKGNKAFMAQDEGEEGTWLGHPVLGILHWRSLKFLEIARSRGPGWCIRVLRSPALGLRITSEGRPSAELQLPRLKHGPRVVPFLARRAGVRTACGERPAW